MCLCKHHLLQREEVDLIKRLYICSLLLHISHYSSFDNYYGKQKSGRNYKDISESQERQQVSRREGHGVCVCALSRHAESHAVKQAKMWQSLKQQMLASLTQVLTLQPVHIAHFIPSAIRGLSWADMPFHIVCHLSNASLVALILSGTQASLFTFCSVH